MRIKYLLAAVAITGALVSLTGCAPERHDVVPSSATVGAEGNERLTFTSDGPGMIYIVDQTDDKLLYSARVPGRRQVVVDPDSNQITVDGQLVQEKTLRGGNNRKIFFHPSAR